MLITGIKSRPVYDRLAPMASGSRHIAVAQGSGGQPLLRLLAEMSLAQRASTTVVYSRESFTGNVYSAELAAVDDVDLHEVETNSAALSVLDEQLAGANMGTRLYLAGSEGFIGTAMQVATAYGLDRDEILREHAGSFVRRVWCAHCDAYTDNVTQRVFRCPGCGLNLVVRDHYSSRLAAFQGVKADGEVPGELPEIEDLDT
jgi:dimethylamine monooxygenase subunit C